LKIVFGAYLCKKCIDSRKTETTMTSSPIPCCTFRSVHCSNKNVYFSRKSGDDILVSADALCAFNCDRPHYGRAVCMQDAIQPTAVGACMVTQAQTATYRIAVLRYTITCLCYDPHPKKEQELSYCKQIVRQLRTQ